MKPDISLWRDDRFYDFYDALPPEGLAWECLRRDKPYQAHYRRLMKSGADDLPLSADAERRWGLRFPRPAVLVGRSAGGHLVPQRRSGVSHP